LRIVVNTRLLIKDKLEGIGWFTFETLSRITRKHPEHTFIFLFDRKPSSEFLFSHNVKWYRLLPQPRHPFLYKIWFDVMIPIALKLLKADLFLSPDGFISLNTSVPTLSVMHDLNFEYYPNDLPLIERNYYKHYFPLFARKATRIATVSEYSKQDIAQLYHIDPHKIDVVYNGASLKFKPIHEPIKSTIRNQYAEGHPYFVFVGSLHPRKNLARLFSAFDLFCQSSPNNQTRLVIVGEKRWWTTNIEMAFTEMKYRNRVLFTGRLSTEKLTQVVGSALAMTYVSNFEGFGIPIIEAYRCDVPVITSKVTSMPEVAGKGALLVDPSSTEDIADALRTISQNEDIRLTLIAEARLQREKFSWDLTAEKLWKSIEATYNSSIS